MERANLIIAFFAIAKKSNSPPPLVLLLLLEYGTVIFSWRSHHPTLHTLPFFFPSHSQTLSPLPVLATALPPSILFIFFCSHQHVCLLLSAPFPTHFLLPLFHSVFPDTLLQVPSMCGANTGGILGAEFSMAAQARTDTLPYKILLPGSPLCSLRTCWGLV